MNQTSTISELLHQEHLHTLAVINDLEVQVAGERSRPLDLANPQDRASLEEFIRMVESDILRHYRFEEEVLFPRMAALGLAPVTEMLTLEHDAVRSMADELRASAVAALYDGFTSASWRDFRHGIMDLVHSVSFHIQKEEMGLIRQIGTMLGTETDRELGALYLGYS